jgi:hypothetical protein
MRTFQIIALAGISMLAMSTSCNKSTNGEDPCPSSVVTITPIPGMEAFSSACFGTSIPSIGQSNQYIINSLADYKSAFTCSPAPVIDFSANTLLVGKTKTASGSFVASQQVQLNCSGEYKYAVKLGNGVTTAVTETVYYALVPKLPSNAKVTFDVQQN